MNAPSRGGTVSGGGGVSPFFTESLAGGVTHETGGFLWSYGSYWSIATDPVLGAGNYAFKITYGPDASDTNGLQGDGDLLFTLGRDCMDFACEWKVYLPANYAHRANASTSENNKWLGLFRDTINNNDAWRGVLEADQTGAAGSMTAVKALEANSGDLAVHYQDGTGVAMANTTGALCTLGAWNTFRMRFRGSTSDGALNGVFTFWINGTRVGPGISTGDYWSWNRTAYPDGAKINIGYFMGASNSGYTLATTFYLKDFAFYDTNPGWT